ncbi:unnamed protein product [Diatraea saccharalis]|uniref:Uncharacterized protein n=1 Tax=Diatraea saccharalis TaxID=40085 RepID=A0A9N9R466_9NEOP|nr:unnamed protein product [Diatraea saccharalis]
MSKDKTVSMKMVATKNKNKVKTCSTPEHQADSPSRDSDSLCGSEAASPVPFLCTQDGVEGDTDVVWNYYTPKADNKTQPQSKNSTPLSRKSKKYFRAKIIERQVPKRRTLRVSHKKTELFQELIELNQKLPELLARKTQNTPEIGMSGSEEDIFNESPEYSPKSGLRSSSRCLRKNVLSSKFTKPDTDTALESDDSMNECLLKASQIVEEKFVNSIPTSPKRACHESYKTSKNNMKSNIDLKMDQDSMDAILNSIKLDSPIVTLSKRYESPKMCNDSFDSFVGNLNDSALEQLTQMPIRSKMSEKKHKTNFNSTSDWTLKEMVVHDSPFSKMLLTRHSSMPVSPIVDNKPSSSGMSFGRYNSMPYDKNADNAVNGDSPIRCTPDEIKKKHQQAREKLLAKRQLPFTSSQQSAQSLPELVQQNKHSKFQPKIPSSIAQKSVPVSSIPYNNTKESSTDIKLIIEKKRQEALMKLRRRQPK